MYRKHFALAQHPFGPESAPENLSPSATSRELETRLAHLLGLRGIGLITGDSVSGEAPRLSQSPHPTAHRPLPGHLRLALEGQRDGLYKTILGRWG